MLAHMAALSVTKWNLLNLWRTCVDEKMLDPLLVSNVSFCLNYSFCFLRKNAIR